MNPFASILSNETSPWPFSVPPLDIDPINGAPFALDDRAGEVVVLTFWATWCPACRNEIPSLNRLQRELEGSVRVVGVSMDEMNAADLNRFLDANDIGYPITFFSGSWYQAFGDIRVTPTTFFIGPDRKNVRFAEGFMGYGDLVRAVREVSETPPG